MTYPYSGGDILNASDLNDFTTGSIGVGTTSPDADIEVESATGTTPTSPTEVRISTSTNGGSWSTTAPWGQLSFWSADTSNGGAKVQTAIATTPVESFGGLGRLGIWTHDGTSLNERMVVTNAGNVGIGTTSPGYTLDVTGPEDTASRVNINSGNTANRYLMRFSRNGSLFTQGVFCDTANASFGTPSDANLKTAVESLDTAEALAAITALRAVSYRYLLDTDDVVRKGFIAQEVDEIIPEAVHRVGGGHPTTRLVPNENGDLVATDVDENGEPLIQEEPDWLMTYEAITTTLVAAVQAQQQMITDLTARVEALEAA